MTQKIGSTGSQEVRSSWIAKSRDGTGIGQSPASVPSESPLSQKIFAGIESAFHNDPSHPESVRRLDGVYLPEHYFVGQSGAINPTLHYRADTITSYYQAVKQAILLMYERFDQPLPLQDMADAVALSPHHFNRVFHHITGITPGHFLCAIRLQAALRLLLTTQHSVTEVCFEVGYNSLGTFTTRFTQLIGLPPTQLRELMSRTPPILELIARCSEMLKHLAPGDTGLRGQITVAEHEAGATHSPAIGCIFVGLFATTIPQGCPVGCTLLTAPGVYQIAAVPDGRYYVFAAAFPTSTDPLSYLIPAPASLRVGMAQGVLRSCGGTVEGRTDIVMRSARLTDPPILSAVPLLLARQG